MGFATYLHLYMLFMLFDHRSCVELISTFLHYCVFCSFFCFWMLIVHFSRPNILLDKETDDTSVVDSLDSPPEPSVDDVTSAMELKLTLLDLRRAHPDQFALDQVQTIHGIVSRSGSQVVKLILKEWGDLQHTWLLDLELSDSGKLISFRGLLCGVSVPCYFLTGI